MIPFTQGDMISQGKAKTLYRTSDPHFLIMEFRDDVSAFDGVKTASLTDKGYINNQINAFVMQELQAAGIDTHHHSTIDGDKSLVYRLDMIPIESVIRNITTGSLCRRLGVEEGRFVSPPIFEFFLKDDERHDPMVNESHILTFGWANDEEIELMRDRSYEVNSILYEMFQNAGLHLVDFKLEFGWYIDDYDTPHFLLGDEFTPDGCRLWDVETGESFDKDRFRKDQGDVVEFYREVANRLGVEL